MPTTMYGPAFDDSQKLVERAVADVDVPAYEKAGYKIGSLPPQKPVGILDVPDDLKGKLPADFPGARALDEAGIRTYAQLRKAGDVTELPGIGKPTAAKIAAALASVPETE